jgi:transmembrane 9 superfamily protein 2/4
MVTAAAGLYVFAYSIVFYTRKLYLKDTASATLYFAWSLVMSVLFSVFTGTVGHFGSFFFVRTIYKAVKVD